MDPFAVPSDVEAIWHPLTEAETGVVAARIAQASRLIRRLVRVSTSGTSLDDLITAGSVDTEDVRDLVADAVLRAMTMPGFVRQESVAVDDGSRSRTYDSSVSGKGGLFFTEDEVAGLVSTVPVAGSGAFSITPGY